jgi:hypothetical protein
MRYTGTASLHYQVKIVGSITQNPPPGPNSGIVEFDCEQDMVNQILFFQQTTPGVINVTLNMTVAPGVNSPIAFNGLIIADAYDSINNFGNTQIVIDCQIIGPL